MSRRKLLFLLYTKILYTIEDFVNEFFEKWNNLFLYQFKIVYVNLNSALFALLIIVINTSLLLIFCFLFLSKLFRRLVSMIVEQECLTVKIDLVIIFDNVQRFFVVTSVYILMH